MARFKLYYPVEEITNDLYTFGGELMTEDTAEYIGPFHRYITGEVYTGATWNATTSKKLIAFKQQDITTIYNTLKPDIRLKYIAPKRSVPQITSADISLGSIQRYFIRKQNESVVFEIDAGQFSNWGSNVIDNKVYTAVRLEWFITGNQQDTKNGNVMMPGIVTKNIQQVKAASQTIPELTTILTNPIEFYVDTDYVTPIDINGLK
jgi:hypothetical protein